MRKILILGDEEKALYHPLSGVADGIQEALQDIGECVFRTDYHGVDMGQLRRYDMVISYIDSFQEMNGFEDVLADYIEEGGKLLALHNGILTPTGSRLEQDYGGNFITHPPCCVLPYYRGQDYCFSMEEEPYMVRMTDDKNKIFLWFSYEGKKCPAGWIRDTGAGRTAYLAPGHDKRTALRQEFQELLKSTVKNMLSEVRS